jgi:hypothetical protein
MLTTAPPTIVATVDGLDGLHDALRARAEVVNVSRLELDRHAGLASGYSGKVLSPMPVKRLTVETACQLAAALGCDLALIENPERLERIKTRSPQREPGHAKHAGAVQFQFSFRYLRQIAKKGGQNSRAYMSRREAKILARKASAARWSKAQEG